MGWREIDREEEREVERERNKMKRREKKKEKRQYTLCHTRFSTVAVSYYIVYDYMEFV